MNAAAGCVHHIAGKFGGKIRKTPQDHSAGALNHVMNVTQHINISSVDADSMCRSPSATITQSPRCVKNIVLCHRQGGYGSLWREGVSWEELMTVKSEITLFVGVLQRENSLRESCVGESESQFGGWLHRESSLRESYVAHMPCVSCSGYSRRVSSMFRSPGIESIRVLVG